MHTRQRVTFQLILAGAAVGVLAAQQLGLPLLGQATQNGAPAAQPPTWCCVEASRLCTMVVDQGNRERRDQAISSNRAERARTPEQADRQSQRLDLAYASTLATMLSEVIAERVAQLGDEEPANRASAEFVGAEYRRVQEAMMASFANADAQLAAASQALTDAALLAVYHTIYEDTAAVVRRIAEDPEESHAVKQALQELIKPPANPQEMRRKLEAMRAKAQELGVQSPLTDEEFAALAGRAVQPGPAQTAAKDRMLDAGLKAFPNLQAGLDAVQGSRDVLTGRTTLHQGAIDAAWSFVESGQGRAGLTMVSALGREGLAAVLSREPDARQRAEAMPPGPGQSGGPGGDGVNVDVQTGPDGTHVTVDVEPGAGIPPPAPAADGQAIAAEVRGHLRRLVGIEDGSSSSQAESAAPASCAQISPVGTQPFADMGPFPTREACMQGCRALSTSSSSRSSDGASSSNPGVTVGEQRSSSEIIGGQERSQQASATISVSPPNRGVLEQNGYGSSPPPKDYNNMEFSSVLGDNGLQSPSGQPMYIPATPADCIRYANTDMRKDPRWNCNPQTRGW